MTDFVADIARWQRDLPLSELVKASFGAVNIKISHGKTYGSDIYPDQPDDLARAKEARGLKLRLSTFHWLTGEASGEFQANLAFSRIKEIGGPAGIAHSVDCEDTDSPPSWTIISSYVATMKKLLGRPIFLYTGDWWWDDRMSGRNGASLTPYLWAAPNRGYPGSYPGDSSTDWKWTSKASGWTALSAMQYDDSSAPFGPGVTTKVKISKTALRDRAVWKAVSGVAW